MRSAEVGVFGGTFNPIHLGHLRAAEEVRDALGLARMIFVLSARPPHKRAGDEQIAPAPERLAWLRLAAADNPAFEVDPIEVERDGPSYSVDTLQAIGERIAPTRPVFVIGRDAFEELGSWREPERLFELAHFAVMTRPPASGGTLDDWLPECVRGDIEIARDGRSGRHRDSGNWLRLVEITALDISASDIRGRLRTGSSARYLVPDPVLEAIARSGCYGETDGAVAAAGGRPLA